MAIFPASKIAAAAYLFEVTLTKQTGAYELSQIAMAGLQDADSSLIATQIQESL